MIFQKQIGITTASTDLPTGGAIVLTGTDRIEMHKSVTVAQTTAAQTITLPTPIDTSVLAEVSVANIGSVSFVMYGVTISGGSYAKFHWNGAAWASDAGPSPKDSITVALVPTADNTVPALAPFPKIGSNMMVHVNSALAPVGIAVNYPDGVVSVTPATLGYNVSATDTLYFTYVSV